MVLSLLIVVATGTLRPNGTIARNEARVMEDLRDVVAAQAAYQSFNCGYYADLGCLLNPPACGLRTVLPRLIEPSLAGLRPRHGYRRAFYPGGPRARGVACSSSELMSYAYTAVPQQEGVTGIRAFCVDETGFIRQFSSGNGVAAKGGCQPGLMAEEPPAVSAEEQERRVIAELRTLESAEQAYRASNSGFNDQPRCLAEPWVCVPGFPRGTLVFLEPRIADLRERNGYRRRFYPGASPRTLRHASPSSLLGYAYTAVPAPGGPPGRRGFCLDPGNGICQTADGSEPRVVEARCLPCEPLVER